MKKRLILTVGPSYIHKNIIKKNHKDHYIYRINGSHGTIKDINQNIKKIREQVKNADILIDLPGNKVRTANLAQPIKLMFGKSFCLTSTQVNIPEFIKLISKGDLVYSNDNTYKFKVTEVGNGLVKFVSKSDGFLENNKGIHVRGLNKKLPFLSKKDKEIITLANKKKITFIGLSFVRTREDIKLAKNLIKHSLAISKIETRDAIKNLSDILEEVDHILIDRGDLSTDIGLINIPHFQKVVIDEAVSKNKKVFLATQFLKTMENSKVPTIAEMIDLTRTLEQNIFGIQLSEEVAIGKYPVDCLRIINQVEKIVAKNSK